MMRAMMKHKSEEKKEKQKIKNEEDEFAKFFLQIDVAIKRKKLELFNPH